MDGELIRADLDRLGLIGRVVIAVGADVVDIDRIRAVVARQPRFVERVYSEAERAYAEARHDPAERYAARFAAKEAVLKALGTGLGGADFVDIEVERLDTGEPRLRLSGRAAERAAAMGAVDWLLTLSHSDDRALAIAVALGDGDSGAAVALGDGDSGAAVALGDGDSDDAVGVDRGGPAGEDEGGD